MSDNRNISVPYYEMEVEGEYYQRLGKEKGTASYKETIRINAKIVKPEEIRSHVASKAIPKLIQSLKQKYPGYRGIQTHYITSDIRACNGAEQLRRTGNVDIMLREDMESFFKLNDIPLDPTRILDDEELRKLVRFYKKKPLLIMEAFEDALRKQEEELTFTELNSSFMVDTPKDKNSTEEKEDDSLSSKVDNTTRTLPKLNYTTKKKNKGKSTKGTKKESIESEVYEEAPEAMHGEQPTLF